MATGVIFEKRGLSLCAIDEAGADELATLPDGKRVAVIIDNPVNEKHYRLWWALVGKVMKSGAFPGDTGWPPTRDGFKNFILWETKRCTPVADVESGKAFFVGSLAIDSFTDPEFKEWFDLAIQRICERLLRRPDWAWLRAELIRACERRGGY